MARIRTIKPEFPHSESMGRVSRDARLTFIQMWTIADDAGRLRGSSRMLASLLFPYDDDAPKKIDAWLDELQKQGCILKYEEGGTSYIQIEKWAEHQKIDRPSASKFPPPSESSRMLANDTRALVLGPKDQGPKEGTKGSSKTREEKITLENLSVDHNAAWLAKKRTEGRYTHHDEHFVLEQFKQYCGSKGIKYADYLDAYRNAFEWEKCQPKSRNPSQQGGVNPKRGWTSEGERLAAEYAAGA